MKHLRTFFLGIVEFRSAYTSTPPSGLEEVYDKGREIAHRLTLRYFEQ